MRIEVKFKNFSFIFAIVILLIEFNSFQNFVYAQDEIIRVDTNLISVPVTVSDRNGRYITNLKKEDFQIFEDGIEQEVVLIDNVEEPFTAFFLFDRSGSMSNHLAEMAYAANAFAKQLRPDDQIIAATFADYLDIIIQPTKVKDLKKAIKFKQNREDRYTRLFDATDSALKKMKKIRGRKVIILFSDGFGEGNSTAKENLREAEEGESLIYTVQFSTVSMVAPSYVNKKTYHKKIEEANNYMRDLAIITGGRPYRIEDILDLEKTFNSIAQELRQQYSLGYYPKTNGKKGERRQIKVKVNIPNVAVRARESYVIGQKN